MKIYEYKLLNSVPPCLNTVHSLVKKLKEKFGEELEIKTTYKLNFILISSKEKLFNMGEKIELTYPDLYLNQTVSTSFVVEEKEQEVTVENFDILKLKGSIFFNFNYLKYLDEEKWERYSEKERNKLRKLSLTEIDHKHKIRQKIQIKKDNDEIVRIDLEREFVVSMVEDYFKHQCEKLYGFKIDNLIINNISDYQKNIIVSTKKEQKQGNVCLTNLISVDMEVVVVDKEKFEKIYYNNVFAKKSYGAGYLNISKLE